MITGPSSTQISAQCCSLIALIIFFLIMLTYLATQSNCRQVSMAIPERHEQWLAKHGKVYKDPEEKQRRLQIFKRNVEFIEAFNAGSGKNASYKLAVNKFADQTVEEFKAVHTGYKPGPLVVHDARTPFKYQNMIRVPQSLDWRNNGAVSPVKDQGQCGSCWAFSSTAAIEGINKLTTGRLVPVSEQELLDCERVNKGCEGGWMENAFKYVIQNNGISSEENYPYKAIDQTCNIVTIQHVVRIKGYEYVPANNEDALLKAVANQPVSIALEASNNLMFYSSGVFTGACGTTVNHAVTVVGYDTSTNGLKYWLMKNSWGPDWGEKGYFRIQRGVVAKEGLCGIAMYASYPTA